MPSPHRRIVHAVLLLSLFLVAVPCRAADKPAAPVPSSWTRPQYQKGGDSAALGYLVYGNFDGPLQVSRDAHRSSGIPAGLTLRRLRRPDNADELDQFMKDPFESAFTQLPELVVAQVRAAQDGALVLGEVPDPANLDYLRDVVGAITALLETGGLAVFDLQARRWHSAESWRKEIFDPNAPVPRQHVSISTSDEEGKPGGLWIRTQGMRKFGRRDVSVRNVPAAQKEAGIDLCNRFIEMMALGAVIPEGHPIKMKSLPAGMTCVLGGTTEDPTFNNTHIEIRWPH